MKIKETKFRKKEIENYNFHIPLIKKEIKDGRHWIATVGTYGFTFSEDIDRLRDYLKKIGDTELLEIMKWKE